MRYFFDITIDKTRRDEQGRELSSDAAALQEARLRVLDHTSPYILTTFDKGPGHVRVRDEMPSYGALVEDLKPDQVRRLAYFVFDLLYMDEFDLRRAPLIERKRVIELLMNEANRLASGIANTSKATAPQYIKMLVG
jgi:hypothetical protein